MRAKQWNLWNSASGREESRKLAVEELKPKDESLIFRKIESTLGRKKRFDSFEREWNINFTVIVMTKNVFPKDLKYPISTEKDPKDVKLIYWSNYTDLNWNRWR